MSESLVVVFTSNNARIFHNPSNFEDLIRLPNAFVNPDLSHVTGIPPHFWKIKDGQIIAMTDYEMTHRAMDIQQHGIENNVIPIHIRSLKIRRFKVMVADLFMLASLFMLWYLALRMLFQK